MKCFYHNDKEAETYCSICGKPICNECKYNIDNTILCKSCSQKALRFLAFSKNEKIKSKGLVFLFSLMPGAGHMYIGMMNRGTQLMAAFFLVLALPDILANNFIFQALAIIIYVFNIFDAQNQVMLYNSGDGKDIGFVDKNFIVRNSLILGIVLIGIGLWGIFTQIFRFSFYVTLNKFLVPISFIALGIYLLKGVFSKKDLKNGV